jgi:uncharacterized repeat protein (TIGR01451 family)
MRVLRSFRRGRDRRYRTLVATLAAIAAFSIVFVAASGAALSDSPFEGSDGNMIVDTPGNTDWCTDFPAPASGTACTTPIAALRTLNDVPSGTSDNSFTQGSKEDNPDVVVAQGSIPPNKNDLTRAYLATEKISGDTFLYLAWERQPNPNGSANIDFELDQNATPGDFTQPGSQTINRTEGDLLITYDFSGSGTPDLGLLTWLALGNGHSNSDCQASGQTLPCWGNRIDLNPGSNPPAEAGVNPGTIDEVLAGGQLDAGSFGEAKIDFSQVPGVFQPDTCKAFGSMFVKSRSSGSSIDAELKDFIGPEPIQLSNCQTPNIATQTSVSSMTIGDTQTVGDTATLSGGDNPTGNVDFQLYSDANCQNAVAGVGASAPLNQNGVATFAGADFSPDHAGTYFWGVSYAGDSHNNPVPLVCGGSNEEIVVGPRSPAIATLLSASAVNHGGTVHDSATLSGATADAGGTVTYSVYSDSSCTTKVADGGTVNVTNGSVPNSNGVTFNTPSTYYWQASYSGDTNNKAAVSPCTSEKLVVAPLIDLAVTKVGSPNPITLGNGNITWTMVVTNNGPDAATGVTTSDPLPATTTFVSVSSTQGSCTGGAVISCSLGKIPAGGTVTITLVTTPTAAGTVTNTVTVVGNETETNTSNNTASASVDVKGFTPPVVFCTAVSKVTPTQLFVGRKTKVTIHVTKHGAAVAGVRVLIKGPHLLTRTSPSNNKGVITQQLKMKKAGILTFTPIASKRCNTKRVGVTGVFTPPVTG